VPSASPKREQLLRPIKHLNELRHLPRALRLVWEAAPGRASLYALLLFLQGVLPVFFIALSRYFIDGLTQAIDQPGMGWGSWWLPGLLMLLLLALMEAAGQFTPYIRLLVGERWQGHIYGLLQQQAIRLDIGFYETTEYYDLLQRASKEAIDGPVQLLESLGKLAQNAITFLSMMAVLALFAWWLPLILLLGTGPALSVSLASTWRLHRWRLRTTVLRRQSDYYHETLLSAQSAAEVRILGLGDYLRERFARLHGRRLGERVALARMELAWGLGAGLFGTLLGVAAMAWMAWQVAQQRFSLGQLAMFWQALSQGQKLMHTLLTQVSTFYRSLLFLDDLFSYLDIQPRLRDPELPQSPPPGLREGVRLEGVAFRYPGSERQALAGFDLLLPAGQLVAIVGENGAGKSTLARLICRLHDPDSGHITWDGIDLRAMAQADLRGRIGLLMQRPLLYQASCAENIAIGELRQPPTAEQLAMAAAASGFAAVAARLPDGLDTVLGKMFGQAELSSGEWQRLALARILVRQAELLILDEPTSAMDPWAEAEWMQRLRSVLAGRTALIITHRFTTAMQADTIHVMAEGRIVESGSHRQLLAAEGRYARSWRAQMERRQEVESVTS